MTSAVVPANSGVPAGRGRRRLKVALLAVVALVVWLPILTFAGFAALALGPIWLAQWRDDHPGASVPADTDASRLAASAVPQTWPQTGRCRAMAGSRCSDYSGTAQIADALTADQAAPILATSVAAAGLSVRETWCRDVLEGVRQCLVHAVAIREGASAQVEFFAFVRVGPEVRRVTFVVDAA